MLKYFATAAMVCTALCSCLSQNYRAVMSWGEYQEATICQRKYEHAINPKKQKSDKSITLMQVGDDYYEPCVKTLARERYYLPQVCLTFLGGAGSDMKLINGAKVEYGWRKTEIVKCRDGSLIFGYRPKYDTPFLKELPAGAKPVTIQYSKSLNLEDEGYGPVHTDWHALYAYPLAAVTAVCIDLPTMIVGNAALGVVSVAPAISQVHVQQQTVPPPAEPTN